jgi:glycosyltransferase involved in cell wall biosynthesis
VRKSISVVVPVMNEAGNIPQVYAEVSSVLKKLGMDYEIIFVNDGSTDDSLREMVSVQKKDSKVKVIEFYKNFGQSAAIQAGFEHAKKELVCYIDGDLQTDFNDLPIFLEKIDKGFDFVVGWRWKRKDTFQKRFFSGLARKMRSALIGGVLHDSSCPFKLFRKECLEGLELYGEMHRYLPALIRWRGYKVAEVKISHRERKHGASKYGLGRLYKGFLDLINVWFWQKYSNRPLHIFGGIGLFLAGLSALMGIVLVSLRLEGKLSLVNSVLPLFVAFLFIIGIIFFCFGLIADILMKIYFSVEHKKSYNIKKIYE